MAPHWRPLLDGSLRDLALEAVGGIAEALRAGPADPPAAGLDRGLAGEALFFLYLDAAMPGEGHEETALARLGAAIEGLGGLVSPALYGGFSGVAWVTEHLQRRLGLEDDLGEEIAFALRDHLSQSPWRRHYDLISGLVGYGVYALERLPRPGAEECLRLTVDRLAELAVPAGSGVSWFTPPAMLTLRGREMTPEGNFNLGVAHGVPGVVSFLASARAAGVAAAAPLLTSAVRWLREQKLPPGFPSVFPYHTAPGVEPRGSELAWCYGDPGVAAALASAARSAGAPDWEAEAVAIGRAAAESSLTHPGVRDACLCHGAAGLGHLFTRLQQPNGDPVLGRAARLWYERALELRRPGEGCAGFLSWDLNEQGEQGWTSAPGFLMGAAGIGLALLPAATSVEPAWDRLLLISGPDPACLAPSPAPHSPL